MFYSQFILAKKGPLGTIWIAAHLERKLRKNQVADTDIGVSVDSILFPDVPIALRLSSHLLLGVVRIYSRKVNYLFDDCSEALLKIKQAFRSTAVDLPPEESTAPYHSITLPETFDLDDFELPDNEIFQGNYVDHHVSTREQITLQDTMEGVVYSTSQFGLDERFGDGDASQIGLDLDEDLFLGKLAARGNDEIADADPDASVQPMTPLTKDEAHEGISRTSATMQINGVESQNEILAANKEAVEFAHLPSSPGLEDEPNLSTIQGDLVHDDNLESKDHSLTDSAAVECTENPTNKSDPHHENNAEWFLQKNVNDDTVMGMHTEDNGYLLGDMESKQAKPQEYLSTIGVTTDNILPDNGLSTSSLSPVSVEHVKSTYVTESLNGTFSTLDGLGRMEDKQNGVLINNEPTTVPIEQMDVRCAESPSCSQVTTELEDSGRRTGSIDFEAQTGHDIANDKGESRSPTNELASNVICPPESPGRPEVVNVETRACQEPNDTETFNPLTHEDMVSSDMPALRACNSKGQIAMSPLGGEDSHTIDATKPVSEKNQISESALCGVTPDDCRKLNEEMDNAASCDNQLENLDRSATLELPAPEKLLAVSEGLTHKPHDLLVDSSPVTEGPTGGNVADAGITNMSGKKRSFTESTLTEHSLNSGESFGVSKLRRTAESVPDDDDLLSSILVGRKSSVLKLKPTPPVPEIISTKRLRSASRASASKRKVLMDDMMVLHGDTIRQQLTNTEDIRRMRKKAPCTRPEISMIQRQFLEEEIFSEPIFTGMSGALIYLHSGTFDLSRTTVLENDPDNASVEVLKDFESSVVMRSKTEVPSADVPIQTQSQNAEDHKLRSEHETVGETAEIRIEGENIERIEGENDEAADAANRSVDGLEASFLTDPVSADFSNMPADIVQPSLVDKIDDVDASLQIDMSCMSPGKFEPQPVEEDASIVNISNGEGVNAVEIGNTAEIGVDLQTDFPEHSNNADVSLTVAALETGGYNSTTFVNGDEPAKQIENDNLGLMNEDEVLASDLGCEDKDLSSTCMHGEKAKGDSAFSSELVVDLKNPSSNDGENAGGQEADPQSVMDVEITADRVEDCRDFEDVTFGNDTEFLNVDDDEMAEDDDDNLPAEDTRLLENSGWSSRTRAVAKYLQILFDKEAVHGRKVLPMDNLIAGKTRKEASRMFFETLVLKTRDYIHVEQPKPFDNISIKPKIKLMKSDF
ncbi:hypothetical protein FEM48_Zijuj02G0042000 [Ziziphus jujuba var. spinosa]|uniref:Sister chromatid cohesion 1 protein 4 n=1 Tax=Ziziphus jujuba var. spinosa TaxID=714518 RepID=A0A978VTJ8_ZIZJJ|nr:hypothetical protein FEM48_Zijuj02G0042000 [Ziziphus jujuba var. spinosa]